MTAEPTGSYACHALLSYRHQDPVRSWMRETLEPCLASDFTDLESVLAEHLGLERSRRRLPMLMRERWTPRVGLRAGPWLDRTDDGLLEPQVTRLVEALRRDPDG
jgi:hypothetical protein